MARRSIRSPDIDVSFVSSGHDVADARLHREAAAMLRVGLSVEVLGLGDPADAPPGTATRTWQRGGLHRRVGHALMLPWRARGRVLVSLDPDSAIGCAVVRSALHRRWVADVHEDYEALLQDRNWARGTTRRLAGWLTALATRVTARADLTVLADDHLPPRGRECRRRLVVRNLPDLQLIRPTTPAVPEGARSLRAVYIGDGRRSRGLEAMLEAVAAAPSWELDLVGPLHGADEAWAQRRAAQPDLLGRARLHGRQPPEISWRIASGADVGLALLDDTPAFREAVPTKVYEYLAAGLAVLATPLPRVAPLVAGSGAGALVTGADDAAAALRRWSADRLRLQEARRCAALWADDHLSGPSPYDVLAEQVAQLAGAR